MSPIKTAAAYIRVSTEDQLEYSPESQLKLIMDYATHNGFSIPGKYVFIDEGISGRKAEKRPGFMKMIATAKTSPKPFDAILLWKFSRFARSRQDSIVYKSMLRKQLGIDVLSVSEHLGDDKISILIEAIIEAMDEYYSINLSEEVRRGMTEKACRGEPLSVPPFGYCLKNKRLVIVPEEAEIIKSVFSQYVSGKSFLRIAKNLNSIGVLTHRGGKIESRTVEYWLNNPVYIGKIRWTPTGKTHRDFNNPDSMIIDGSHEPIIENELWQQAQELLTASGSRRGRSRDLSHWLVGLLRCGLCGGPMVNCRGYFYCSNKNKGFCIGSVGVKVQMIADILSSVLNSFIRGLPPVSVVPRMKIDPAAVRERRLSSAMHRLQRAKEAYVVGIDSLEEYRSNKEKISAEISEIENEFHSPSPLRQKLVEPLCISDLLYSNDLSNEMKNSILRSFVRKVELSRDNISIEMCI